MGPGPLSPPTASSPPSLAPEEDVPASLGEIVMAMKEAQDPKDAARFLLEFLAQAGFEPSRGTKKAKK